MIKSNELRLGNLVNRRGETGVVVSLDIEDVCVRFGGEYGDFERWYFESIDPIPLTPDILEKCGFEKYVRAADYIEADENHPLDFADLEDWTIYEIEKLQFFVGVRGSMFSVVQEGACYDESTGIHKIGVYIKHLHQLQNLFFALTGEELTIKETV